jgi:hypothetical protein
MINNNSGSNLAKVKKLFTRVLFFTQYDLHKPKKE